MTQVEKLRLPAIDGERSGLWLPKATTSRQTGFRVSHAQIPFEFPSGGDLQAAFTVPDGSGDLALILGDVAGHGPAKTAQANRLLEAISKQLCLGASPAETMNFVNAKFEADPHFHDFATVFIGRLADSGVLTYSGGGQEAPLLASLSSRVQQLNTSGPPVGVVPGEGVEFVERTVVVQPQATVVLYTDGLTDAKYRGHLQPRFGHKRLQSSLAKFVGFP